MNKPRKLTFRVDYFLGATPEATQLYLKLKNPTNDKIFKRTADRNTKYVCDVIGNRPISSYTSVDATKFRDWLYNQGYEIGTIKRIFSSVKAIMNLAISECGLACKNVFAGIFFPEKTKAEGRKTFPTSKIPALNEKCRRLDDEARWLISLIQDTGMRLGEAVGLTKSDIVLNETIPHAIVKPHNWRRLKTQSSHRKIPLVGDALWAAKRAVSFQPDSRFLFPKYCN